MTSDFSSQEFIDDFLVEAGEHLQAINQNLLKLEQFSQGTSQQAVLARDELLEELLRSYHTIKGLAGMIGLLAASQISHDLEHVLKKVQRAEVELQPVLFDALFAGTQALADWVETLRRPDHPTLPVEEVLDNLEKAVQACTLAEDDFLVSINFTEKTPEESAAGEAPSPPPETARQAAADKETSPSASPSAAPAAEVNLANLDLAPDILEQLKPVARLQLEQALASGQPVYRIRFAPSPEKASAGHTINTLRAQIEAAGHLLLALPRIAEGQVHFELLAAFPQPPDPASFVPADWELLRLRKAAATRPRPSASSRQLEEHLSLRVGLEQMNQLMQLTGKMVVLRSRLRSIARSLPPNDQQETLEEALEDMDRTLRDLRDTVTRTRMVPIQEIFARVPLIVRDISRQNGKQVSLNIIGQNTEIDKVLAERLSDPILHLVRNALTHGIEPPEERSAQGKPPVGTLTLRGATAGDNVLIYVQDDGAGLNLDAIRQKAQQKGLLPHDRESITTDEALQLICQPGFSTRDSADMGAGRGVGMDVVYQAISAIGGSLNVESTPGQGTTFILKLPLSLAIIDAFLIQSGANLFAVPRSSVARILEIPVAQITRLENALLWKEPQSGYLRLHDMSDLLGLPRSQQSIRHGLVCMIRDWRDVLLCDRVVGLQEIVVQTAEDPLIQAPGLLGAAELGDGRLILIYDPEQLILSRKSVAEEPAHG